MLETVKFNEQVYKHMNFEELRRQQLS